MAKFKIPIAISLIALSSSGLIGMGIIRNLSLNKFGSNLASIIKGDVAVANQKTDHKKFDFVLDKKHSKISCNTCHIKGSKDSAYKLCAACHVGGHQLSFGQRGKLCGRCHGASGNGYFNHKENWLNKRPHRKKNCLSCHNKKLSEISTQCSSCHNPPANHYSGSCSSCHSSYSWSNASVSHNGWIRSGAHAGLSCFACHGSKGYNISSACSSCHNRSANHFTGSCGNCHSTSGWGSVNINHPAGVRSGAHKRLSCNSCHGRRGYNISSTCSSCHNAPANHYSGGCSKCHNTSSFGSAAFKHPGGIRYSGAHSRLGCNSCHGGRGYNISSTCSSCHGRPSGHYSGNCSKCHNTSNWRASFNHPGIGGPHSYRSFSCKSCHPGGYGSHSCTGCHGKKDPDDDKEDEEDD